MTWHEQQETSQFQAPPLEQKERWELESNVLDFLSAAQGIGFCHVQWNAEVVAAWKEARFNAQENEATSSALGLL